ncbi:MAG: transcription termination/antitermination protein NusG [bacterium]
MNESDTVESIETVELIEGGRWYAIRTFTGHEEKVKVGIETEAKRLHLGDRILEVVIPKETVYEVRAGKRKTREKNFLPGYILVRCNMDAKLKEIIQNLPSIVSFVGRKNDPTPLQAFEVERIFGRVEERRDISTVETKFQVGDPVKVIDGPFNTFSGTVREINEEKQKLKVEVQILGRRTPVELDFSQIELEA